MQRRIFVLVRSESHAVWEPPVDVFASADETWIVIALPGVDSAGIDIALEDGYLRVSGRREFPEVCVTADLCRLEIPVGRFARLVPLSPGRFEIVSTEAKEGCLVVRLKKIG